MNSMNAYLSLLDFGYPIDEQAPPYDPLIALMHLLPYACVHTKLPCEVSWRLDHKTIRELERTSGIRPSGGWREFASLAAGAQFFRATADAFIPITTLEDILDDTTETLCTRLLESFTLHLAPPGAAASLFLVMGIHPVWGLRLAYASNRLDYADDMRFGERDHTVFPNSTLQTMQKCVYGMISCIIATLRNLDPEKSYSIDALTNLINVAGQYSRRQTAALLKTNDTLGLPVFLSEDTWTDEIKSHSHLRSVEIATRSYIDQIFVPAGAIRRFEDGTFTVFEGAFDNIRVGNFDDNTQNQMLAQFLSDITGEHQVA